MFQGSLYDTLDSDSRFITLVRALDISDGLSEVLGGDDDDDQAYTIFAPTDEAFDKIPREALNELLDDRDALTDVLLRHVVKGTKLSGALSFVDLKSLAGTDISVRTKRGRVLVNDAVLEDGDVLATNGAIQIIDKVLL